MINNSGQQAIPSVNFINEQDHWPFFLELFLLMGVSISEMDCLLAGEFQKNAYPQSYTPMFWFTETLSDSTN